MHRCREVSCRTLIPIEETYCDTHAGLHPKWQGDKTKRYRKYDKARQEDEERKARHSFYNKTVWKKTRQAVMDQQHRLCGYCLLCDRVTPAQVVDHIVPREVAPSMDLDMGNLMASCMLCHQAKTEWEQGYYGTGQHNKLNKKALPIKDVEMIKFVFDRDD
ncbi:MAG: HNH endonuclease [Lactobacillaceae bacterium]|nr:HNH endonuclease [Lactobacillaceae bacterium]